MEDRFAPSAVGFDKMDTFENFQLPSFRLMDVMANYHVGPVKGTPTAVIAANHGVNQGGVERYASSVQPSNVSLATWMNYNYVAPPSTPTMAMPMTSSSSTPDGNCQFVKTTAYQYYGAETDGPLGPPASSYVPRQEQRLIVRSESLNVNRPNNLISYRRTTSTTAETRPTCTTSSTAITKFKQESASSSNSYEFQCSNQFRPHHKGFLNAAINCGAGHQLASTSTSTTSATSSSFHEQHFESRNQHCEHSNRPTPNRNYENSNFGATLPPFNSLTASSLSRPMVTPKFYTSGVESVDCRYLGVAATSARPASTASTSSAVSVRSQSDKQHHHFSSAPTSDYVADSLRTVNVNNNHLAHQSLHPHLNNSLPIHHPQPLPPFSSRFNTAFNGIVFNSATNSTSGALELQKEQKQQSFHQQRPITSEVSVIRKASSSTARDFNLTSNNATGVQPFVGQMQNWTGTERPPVVHQNPSSSFVNFTTNYNHVVGTTNFGHDHHQSSQLGDFIPSILNSRDSMSSEGGGCLARHDIRPPTHVDQPVVPVASTSSSMDPRQMLDLMDSLLFDGNDNDNATPSASNGFQFDDNDRLVLPPSIFNDTILSAESMKLTKEANRREKVRKNSQVEVPRCSCPVGDERGRFMPGKEPPVYTTLGAARNLAKIRKLMEKRTGVNGQAIRIETVIYTGNEGKAVSGCPIAKWIIRRSGPEEKYLVLARQRTGHVCKASWLIVVIVAWEGVEADRADDLYDMLVYKLTNFGLITQRRCGSNDRRTCACQGEDIERAGASFSFGCAWSMYYNGCKFARSQGGVRKFRLTDESEEAEVENDLQSLATNLAPFYQKVAPDAYRNQTVLEQHGLECRLGTELGRPWTGVTACVDFCAHAHKDLHNMNHGSTVVVTLTKHRGYEKPDDEQLHVLPLYILDDADELGSKEGQEMKVANGSLEVLKSYPMELRLRRTPLKACRLRAKDHSEVTPKTGRRVIIPRKAYSAAARAEAVARAATAAASAAAGASTSSVSMTADCRSGNQESGNDKNPSDACKRQLFPEVGSSSSLSSSISTVIVNGAKQEGHRPIISSVDSRYLQYPSYNNSVGASGMGSFTPSGCIQQPQVVEKSPASTSNNNYNGFAALGLLSEAVSLKCEQQQHGATSSCAFGQNIIKSGDQTQRFSPPDANTLIAHPWFLSRPTTTTTSSSYTISNDQRPACASSTSVQETPKIVGPLPPTDTTSTKFQIQTERFSTLPDPAAPSWHLSLTPISTYAPSPSSSSLSNQYPISTNGHRQVQQFPSDHRYRHHQPSLTSESRLIGPSNDGRQDLFAPQLDMKRRVTPETANGNHCLAVPRGSLPLDHSPLPSFQSTYMSPNSLARFAVAQRPPNPYDHQQAALTIPIPQTTSPNYYTNWNKVTSPSFFVPSQQDYPLVDYVSYILHQMSPPPMLPAPLPAPPPPPPSVYLQQCQPLQETPPAAESKFFHEHSDNVDNFRDSSRGGVAIALSHGSVLFECAKHELHATTALKTPNRQHPSRISLVFYQHKSMNARHHGQGEYEEKARQKKDGQLESAAERILRKQQEKKLQKEHKLDQRQQQMQQRAVQKQQRQQQKQQLKQRHQQLQQQQQRLDNPHQIGIEHVSQQQELHQQQQQQQQQHLQHLLNQIDQPKHQLQHQISIEHVCQQQEVQQQQQQVQQQQYNMTPATHALWMQFPQ